MKDTAHEPWASRAGSHALQHAELAVADTVGRLMELWGFRRQLGRIWAVLFLSERPLAAPDLCERLRISTGLLSMSLSELRRWGVVRSVNIAGDRKEHFEAETNIWALIRRVLAERERKAIDSALESVEMALGDTRRALLDVDPEVKASARFRIERLEQLATLCQVGQSLLGLLIDSARVDVAPLKLLSEGLSGRGHR
ncbi:MAG TPA: ArsR family transcriptional regulator [Anaeromyxobacteraceae bacterium]|nr:ArsR family transcriptional regulator [Anaeromyxobacteraceae bacterium]